MTTDRSGDYAFAVTAAAAVDLLDRAGTDGEVVTDWFQPGSTLLVLRVALPRDTRSWGPLLHAAALLSPHAAGVEVMVLPERGRFSLNPIVLSESWRRRHDHTAALARAHAATAGLRVTPQQVRVLDTEAMRKAVGLPPGCAEWLTDGLLIAEYTHDACDGTLFDEALSKEGT